MEPYEVKIKLDEEFPHLPNAPIVEAVIEIRTRAQVVWDERTISERLKAKLAGYQTVISQRELQQEVKFGPGQAPQASQQDLGWKGLGLRSTDGHHVVQFNRDGFLFSRLHPYQDWEHLRDEALRLWRVHFDVASPADIQRLGLRFINRIILPVRETRFEEYIKPHPVPPENFDLPFIGFLHVDTLSVPGHPYAISIARTVQQPQDSATTGFAVILDIDVFTPSQMELHQDILVNRLNEMRWLKNKAFFGSITQKALDSFR